MENEYNKKSEKMNNMENRAQKNQYSNFIGKGSKKKKSADRRLYKPQSLTE